MHRIEGNYKVFEQRRWVGLLIVNEERQHAGRNYRSLLSFFHSRCWCMYNCGKNIWRKSRRRDKLEESLQKREQKITHTRTKMFTRSIPWPANSCETRYGAQVKCEIWSSDFLSATQKFIIRLKGVLFLLPLVVRLLAHFLVPPNTICTSAMVIATFTIRILVHLNWDQTKDFNILQEKYRRLRICCLHVDNFLFIVY